MNTVNLTGHLVRDHKIIKGKNEKIILHNTVATQKPYKEENGKYGYFYIDISAFGPTAEFIKKNFKKGSGIGITGHIETGKYTKKDGAVVYTTEVVVDNAEFGQNDWKETK